MNIQGFKPEPIAIPVAAGPSGMDLPLSASGCGLADALDSARCYPSCAADGASHSLDPKAAARQLDSDRLIASLANSEIQPDELQMVCSIGHGSSGNVSQVLHMPTSSVLALKSIPVDADETSRKAILLELKALLGQGLGLGLASDPSPSPNLKPKLKLKPKPKPKPKPNPNQGAARLHARGHRVLLRRLLPRGRGAYRARVYGRLAPRHPAPQHV